jgi:hypothetical protein
MSTPKAPPYGLPAKHRPRDESEALVDDAVTLHGRMVVIGLDRVFEQVARGDGTGGANLGE